MEVAIDHRTRPADQNKWSSRRCAVTPGYAAQPLRGNPNRNTVMQFFRTRLE